MGKIPNTETLKSKIKEFLKRTTDNVKACEAFYGEFLQGNSVTATIKGQKAAVFFTQRGKNKLYNLAQHGRQLEEILPYLPEIIKTGKCSKYRNNYKSETVGRKSFDGFWYFTKKITTSKGSLTVIVDVGYAKEQDKRQQYSFITDKDRGYNAKKEALKRDGIIIEDADVITPVVSFAMCSSGIRPEETIPTSFEFVNITIKNFSGGTLESSDNVGFQRDFDNVIYAFNLE